MTRLGFLRAVGEILGVPTRSLRAEDTRDNLAQWTSLADANIFALIASEFGIELDDELIAAETIGDLIRILQDRRAFQE
jgi:acyl carrier protein